MNDAPKPKMPNFKMPKSKMPKRGKASRLETPTSKALKAKESKVTLPLAPSPTIGVTQGYMSGFGNSFETEALAGALPIGRNSPQKCRYGLYAEQLSGSPFTAPRASNERSWLYRIRPSVKHSGRFAKVDIGLWRTAPCHEHDMPIGQLRWGPQPLPKKQQNFLEGMRTMTTGGDAATLAGMGAHVYLATRSMRDEYFYNADGEMLIVPQQGRLRIFTEFGLIEIEPGEIAVIPRGVKLRVELTDGAARGYMCENYGGAFAMPERGPIGANCLANARDFLTPVAAFEDKETPSKLYVKWGGQLFASRDCVIRRSMSLPGTAITRPTNTICGVSRRSARSPSIIRIRRSSRCSPRPRRRPARRMSISSFSPSAGRSRRIPSARPGTI